MLNQLKRIYMMRTSSSQLRRWAVASGAFVLVACQNVPLAAEPQPSPKSEAKSCVVSGCSRQVCSEGNAMTTCEWREEYACYRTARCERDAADKCGWRNTAELQACLDAKRAKKQP